MAHTHGLARAAPPAPRRSCQAPSSSKIQRLNMLMKSGAPPFALSHPSALLFTRPACCGPKAWMKASRSAQRSMYFAMFGVAE
eukprot:3672658-Prymnesium_polylepis.1